MTGQILQRNHPRPPFTFSEAFKRMVVREFEEGYLNKKELSRKHGILGHATILKWCRIYGAPS